MIIQLEQQSKFSFVINIIFMLITKYLSNIFFIYIFYSIKQSTSGNKKKKMVKKQKGGKKPKAGKGERNLHKKVGGRKRRWI